MPDNKTVTLMRTRDQWAKCDPEAMCHMSQAEIFHALNDAKHDVLAMHDAMLAAAPTPAAQSAGQEAVAWIYEYPDGSIPRHVSLIRANETTRAIMIETPLYLDGAPVNGGERDNVSADLTALANERRVSHDVLSMPLDAAKSAADTPHPCPACGGNDGNMPCAYPEGGQPGCPRDVRLGRAADVPVNGGERDEDGIDLREAAEMAVEAFGLLGGLIWNIRAKGNYSQETTIRFLEEAQMCLYRLHGLVGDAGEHAANAQQVGDGRCYAPSCGKWDGNATCTCAALSSPVKVVDNTGDQAPSASGEPTGTHPTHGDCGSSASAAGSTTTSMMASTAIADGATGMSGTEQAPAKVSGDACERCGEPSDMHTGTYWCDNQSFVKVGEDEPHSDDIAVDRFTAAMKAKLAKKRAQGRGGWDDERVCSPDDLARMLVEHLPKGDPVDVGNFAMMLFNRPDSGAALCRAADLLDEYAALTSPAKVGGNGLIEQHGRDSAELRRLCAARDEARRTAEYWKANHLAGNAEIERLRNLLEAKVGGDEPSDAEIERLALEHISPHAKTFAPDKDYKETEQFRRVKAYTLAMFAARAALSADIQHERASIIAGALFDFMGHLTSRDEVLTLSAAHLATPAVDALAAWAKKRGLSLNGARVEDWQAALSADGGEDKRDAERLDWLMQHVCADEIEGIRSLPYGIDMDEYLHLFREAIDAAIAANQARKGE